MKGALIKFVLISTLGFAASCSSTSKPGNPDGYMLENDGCSIELIKGYNDILHSVKGCRSTAADGKIASFADKYKDVVCRAKRSGKEIEIDVNSDASDWKDRAACK